MSDVLFLVLTAVFFTAAWGLVIGCERLLGASDDDVVDEPSGDVAADRVPAGAA